MLVWVFVVENLLFGFVPSVGRFTPGRAQDALTGMCADHLLPAAAGGSCSSSWSLGLFAAGLAARGRATSTRPDVGLLPMRQAPGEADPRLGQCSGMTPEPEPLGCHIPRAADRGQTRAAG